MDSQLVANIISAVAAFATVAAVVTAFIAIQVNRKQAQQTQYGSSRPLLVPNDESDVVSFQPDHPTWLEWKKPVQMFHICNIGTGSAFNVASIWYGAESYVLDARTMKRSDDAKDTH